MKQQRDICELLCLKGRILLAHEGINATLGGSCEALEQYKAYMESHELFGGIDFKESEGSAADFPRLRVVVKDEIVKFGLDTEKVTARDGGMHLTPEEAHALMQENPENLVILDARNNYESRVGAFTNSLTPDIDTFRELPGYVDTNLEKFKDKKVLMVCTGGIRCERASAYVKQKGVAQQVYQVLGGIHRYVEKFPNGFFRGKNYVFDARVAVTVNDDVLTHCDLCKTSCNEFTNCLSTLCNAHFVACHACLQKYNNCCSAQCQQAIAAGTVPMRKKPLPQPGVHKLGVHQ